MTMLRRAADSQAAQGSLLDDLAEIGWLLRMAQLGIGFNPDLLALAENLNERALPQLPAICASRPMAGANGVR